MLSPPISEHSTIIFKSLYCPLDLEKTDKSPLSVLFLSYQWDVPLLTVPDTQEGVEVHISKPKQYSLLDSRQQNRFLNCEDFPLLLVIVSHPFLYQRQWSSRQKKGVKSPVGTHTAPHWQSFYSFSLFPKLRKIGLAYILTSSMRISQQAITDLYSSRHCKVNHSQVFPVQYKHWRFLNQYLSRAT